MKLLTLNTHSLIEDDYENKLRHFVDAICRIKPDVMALQEVNQSCDNTSDNHAYRVKKLLESCGLSYNTEWLPIKNGYGKFDEGIAIFSLSPITDKREILLSGKDDYSDWRTRKALGIKTEGEWFYSVHFGWWNDEKEPFYEQWERFENSLNHNESIWVLGDLNSPANALGEGYDYVIDKGWYDTFIMANKRDEGFTVSGKIDGWCENIDKKRIDYILTNKKREIASSAVVFNGSNERVVSDHFGILVSL
ncbi:MAG: endonuclease/exonuclease/phosphatase family protein [Clostridia bacterium]|nr:endonuclease/exonuclease/phosphatase family protein [Clostridia bacterium]